MRLLIDTHVLLWWLFEPHKLPQRVKDALAEPDSVIHVSAATIMEVATKHRIGKLAHALELVEDFAGTLHRMGFQPLSIDLESAALAGRMPLPNKDPFDRFIAAQALTANLVLVSNEQHFDSTGVIRLW